MDMPNKSKNICRWHYVHDNVYTKFSLRPHVHAMVYTKLILSTCTMMHMYTI